MKKVFGNIHVAKRGYTIYFVYDMSDKKRLIGFVTPLTCTESEDSNEELDILYSARDCITKFDDDFAYLTRVYKQ